MTKTIKLFTEVPLETLGDAFSARKLLNSFEADDDIEIEWVIIRDKPIEDKGLVSIPKVKVTHVTNWSELNTRLETSSYKEADMYFVYPHIPADSKNKQELKKFLKQIPQDRILAFGSEYNPKDTDDHEYFASFYPFVQQLMTGFKALGVYAESPKSIEQLLQGFQESEKEINEILFQAQSEEKYFFSNHLYFGYLNTSIENEVSDLNKVDRDNFVLACIRDALHENKENKKDKNIDIVVPVDFKMFQRIFKGLTDDEKSQLGSVSWQSRTKSEFIKNEKGIHLRLINPFPLKHPAMLYFIARSNPLTMCTGDQSFTEALIFCKICLYQIMNWKSNFYAQYMEELAVCCEQSNFGGKNSEIYQFYALLNKATEEDEVETPKSVQWKTILNFYHEHSRKILNQQKKFSEHMLKNCNLNKNFRPAILNILNHSHPILRASSTGDSKALNQLLSENKISHEEIRDTFGNTPLILAVRKQALATNDQSRKQYADCLEKLIKAGYNINAVNNKNESALTWAIRNKNIELIKLLLSHNASFEHKYDNNQTILEFAESNIINNEWQEIARMIIQHHNARYLDEMKSIHISIATEKEKFLHLFPIAAMANRLDVIETLMKHINLNTKEAINMYFMALNKAMQMGHEECVNVLLSFEKQINITRSENPNLSDILIQAAELNQQKTVIEISKKFPELISQRSFSVLDDRIVAGDLALTKHLWSLCTPEMKEAYMNNNKDCKWSIINSVLRFPKNDIRSMLNFLIDDMKLNINSLLEVYIRDHPSIQFPIVELLINKGANFDYRILDLINSRINTEEKGRTEVTWRPSTSYVYTHVINTNLIEELKKTRVFLKDKIQSPIVETKFSAPTKNA